MKRIFVLFILLFLATLVMISYDNKDVEASVGTPIVNFILEHKSLNAGETVQVKISLNNFDNLYSAELMIKCDVNVLKPILVNNQYFNFSNNRLFSVKDQITLNDFVDNKYLRINLYKGENIDQGYQTNAFNSLVEINFIALQKVESVSDLFQVVDLKETLTGVKLILTNSFGQNITYQARYSEKLKTNWQVSSYQIEVFDPLPAFLNDLTITNREANQYLIEAINDEVNPNLIGLQVLKVKIIDLINNESYYLAKPLQVLDLTPPEIIVDSEKSIKDIDILTTNFLFASVTDNYDANVKIVASFFDNLGNELTDVVAFINYISRNSIGKIVYRAYDQSKNEAVPKTMQINIIDTTPPTLNLLEPINLDDTLLDSFVFEDLLIVIDTYDLDPAWAYYAVDKKGLAHEDYREILLIEKQVTIHYFGFDRHMNKTPIYEVKIKLVDTTPPIITGIKDLELRDVDLETTVFASTIFLSDNFDEALSLQVVYRLNEITSEEVDYQTFIEGIKQGDLGFIQYCALDKAGNSSEIVNQKINVLDTTPPLITVDDIVDGKKYFKLMPLTYQVTDNFKDEMTIEVYLNDTVYENQELTLVGLYELKIIATDLSGNIAKKIVNFEIIKDDVISCRDDISCYLNNYQTVIMLVGAILSLVFIITISQVLTKRRQKQKRTFFDND